METWRQFIRLDEVFSEVKYFLEFNKAALMDVLIWKISLWAFGEVWNEKYNKALKRSQDLDRLYEWGSMWRLAITEWWPNEIQYYNSEREKCMKILAELWIE